MLLGAASACGVLAPDSAHDARQDCDKKHDGSACFLAGNLVVEKNGGELNADAVRLFTKGCAARSSASCEQLGNVKGSMREQALVDGCNGGDLVSCVRRATELPKDEAGQNEARALLHSACKQSVGVRPGMSAREIEGVGEACAALARMIAAGEGGGKDPVAAAKLDVLAAVLRTEALYQHEREDDAKILPHPAQKDAPPPKHKGGILETTPVDPTLAEREKFRKEYEARRVAREAWMASVDGNGSAAQRKGLRGDPTMPALGPLERATAGGPASSGGGGSQCQQCVDGCGGMARCTGDDFVGGRCGHLRGTDSAAFDGCVAECAAKAETCTKACGDCGAAEPPPAPPAKGGR